MKGYEPSEDALLCQISRALPEEISATQIAQGCGLSG